MLQRHEANRAEENQVGDDVDGLDIVVLTAAVIESWKIVLLVPVLAGLVVFGAAFLLRPQYETYAIARLNSVQANTIRLPVVLDPVGRDLGYVEKYAGSVTQARRDLANRIDVLEAGEN